MSEVQVPVNDKESLEKEASLIISNLNNADTRKELTDLGNNLHKGSGKSYNLMKTKMSTIMEDNPKRKDLESDMAAIKEAVEELSPDSLGSLSFWQKLVTRNPVGKKLEKIKEGYQSAESRLTSIETGLLKGSNFLQEDNLELGDLFEGIHNEQEYLEKNTFVLERVVEDILERQKKPDHNPTPKDIVFESEMINKLQDFKIMIEANKQFKASILMTVEGNAALLTSVNRLSRVVGTVARSGLMIQASLLRQENMVKMVNGTKDFVGNTMKSNAQMIKDNVSQVKSVISSPSINMEDVVESHRILKSAVEETIDCRNQIMSKSKASLAELDSLMDSIPDENSILLPTTDERFN
jgi:uncharacterized protein YaaN involved in tellurite resistance